jgi:hypothetical protein
MHARRSWQLASGGSVAAYAGSQEDGRVEEALNLDSPTPPPPLSIIRPGLEPPPRKLAKEVVVGNESATGPELASVVPKVAGVVEVIAGRWPEAAGGRRSDEGNGAEPGGC